MTLFKISQKVSKYLGYFCVKITLKNRPIWTHCTGRKLSSDGRERPSPERVHVLLAADGDDPLLLLARLQLGRHAHAARRNLLTLYQGPRHLHCHGHLVQ